MTTGNIADLQPQPTNDDRPTGIPRPGRLGVATSELFLAIAAFIALSLVALAFFYSSR